MAELVDAHGSGPCAARCGGSSPLLGTSTQHGSRKRAISLFVPETGKAPALGTSLNFQRRNKNAARTKHCVLCFAHHIQQAIRTDGAAPVSYTHLRAHETVLD